MPTPTFIIIGAAKAGTTALYHYLSGHPEVFMSPVKETNFFAFDGQRSPTVFRRSENDFPIRTWAEYCALFATAGSAKAIGEASPLYLASPVASRNIRAMLPQARLIVSLRDPVDRAYSDYVMRLRTGAERRPANVALSGQAHSLQGGFYYDRLRRYFDVFPREQILAILAEEMRADVRGTLRQIFRFVGVDDAVVPDLNVLDNKARLPRISAMNRALTSPLLRHLAAPLMDTWIGRAARRLRDANLAPPPPMPPELRSALRDVYRDEIARVEALLERPLPAWQR